MEDDKTLSRSDALEKLEKNIHEDAAFHLFLVNFSENYIYPYFPNLSREQQIEIANLLNDFRDIVDPEHFVPFYFKNANWIEASMRENIIKE
jgi:hypothetical protein